jgi:hypothetical protein
VYSNKETGAKKQGENLTGANRGNREEIEAEYFYLC